MSVFASNVAIMLGLLLAIPIIIGCYVYRDASRRGMNAVLWTLIAVLAPTLIGLVVYLLIRGSYSDLRCPKCNTTVKADYVVCPNCGTKLHATCPNCAMPVESGWKVCPKCTQPLTDAHADVQPPIRTKDNSIWKVLAVIILIPTLLILVLVVGFSAFSDGGASTFVEDSFDSYFEMMNADGTPADAEAAQSVQKWLDNLEIQEYHAYALQYEHTTDTGNDYFILLYVPDAGHQYSCSFGQSSSIFGTTLNLALQYTGNSGYLYNIKASADKAPNLKITLNGKRIPCSVTNVQYNPTRFFIVPQYDQIDPSVAEFWLPERVSVVKLVSNHNEGVVEVTDEDTAFKLLADIDSAPYLDLEHPIYGRPDGSGGYDFKDGFDITIEYRVHEDLVLHDDMIHCLVFEQDGSYYLIDDRADHGQIFREVDADFYGRLVQLFD